MNRFYEIPIFLQWGIAIIFALLIFYLADLWFELTKQNLGWYFLIFLFVPVSQFAATPILRLIGIYKYLSPMLLVFSPSKKMYDIHNGTSFDYLFVLRNIKRGTPLRNKILEYYMQGLLCIIQKVESGELPGSIIIKGSSYFFSESTVKRIGFSLGNASIFEIFNIVINYLDLLWMYSVSHGRLTFPDLRNIKMAKITGDKLVRSKMEIKRIHEYLVRKN